jgi:hypothetical protein
LTLQCNGVCWKNIVTEILVHYTMHSPLGLFKLASLRFHQNFAIANLELPTYPCWLEIVVGFYIWKSCYDVVEYHGCLEKSLDFFVLYIWNEVIGVDEWYSKRALFERSKWSYNAYWVQKINPTSYACFVLSFNKYHTFKISRQYYVYEVLG